MKYTDFFLDFVNEVKKNKFTEIDVLNEPIISQILIDKKASAHAALFYAGHYRNVETKKLEGIIVLNIYQGRLKTTRDQFTSTDAQKGIWLTLEDVDTVSEFIDMLVAYDKPLRNYMEVGTSHEWGVGQVCFLPNRPDKVRFAFEPRNIEDDGVDYYDFHVNIKEVIKFFTEIKVLLGSKIQTNIW